jgi:ferritin-like metal-binding protein YciE
MADKGLKDLFEDTLKDVYYAEKQILKNLPELEEAASSAELKKAFKTHYTETEGQVKRLEQVFELCDLKPSTKRCDGIEGILKEGESVLKEFKGTSALDAGLISSAQAVEHYEITRYGTLRRWAQELGLTEAAQLLTQTLEEESHTDDLLTQIAEAGANAKAS